MRSEIYGIVSDIIELASSFDVISFGWISRERNLNADKLAKLCLLEVEAFMAITCLAFVTLKIKSILSFGLSHKILLVRLCSSSVLSRRLPSKLKDLVASDTETNDVATIVINRCDQPHDIETNNSATTAAINRATWK
ncbi:hypothetical protein YC2023_013446 [Brassica napus]